MSNPNVTSIVLYLIICFYTLSSGYGFMPI